MADNQIVSSIINNTLSAHVSVGERYIIKKDDKYVISEHDGTNWKNMQQSFEPKYIFVGDVLQTVILFSGKIWTQKKWFICSGCGKLTSNRMKITKNVQEMCLHCVFQNNYDNPNRSEYDGNPMTITKYIQTYAKMHIMDKCSNPQKCFLCDYKKGKLILNIKDMNILYGCKLMDVLREHTIDIEI